MPYDGVGREVRNGLNFTERGFGVRGALGCSDRGHTAASQLRPGDVDWERIFGAEGARWFHCGGIFAALSEPDTAALAREAMEAARRHGTIVSYDLNYRPSLWKASGGTGARGRGQRAARRGTSTCCSATRRTSPPALGYSLDGVDEHLLELDAARLRELLGEVIGGLSAPGARRDHAPPGPHARP